MFLTDLDFRKTVAGFLKTDEAELAPEWDDIARQAHLSAYKDVRGALLARSFTPAQIDAWDRGAEFERDIGLYWCVVRGGRPAHLDPADVGRLDRRAELLTVPVEVASGDAQGPAGEPSRIAFGVLALADADGKDDRWTKDTAL